LLIDEEELLLDDQLLLELELFDDELEDELCFSSYFLRSSLRFSLQSGFSFWLSFLN